MKNRPDKPGNWWWEDNDGDHYVAYFDDDMDYMVRTDGRMTDYLSVGQFEEEFDVKHWIGKAVPLDDVKEYLVD